MNTAWSEDFSYPYFRRLISTLQEKFRPRRLGDGLAPHSEQPQLFLRHDVDVCLRRALTMAKIEADCGFGATYLVMPHSRLYDLQRERERLRRLIRLGHEVGLHFDVDDQRRTHPVSVSDLLVEIERDCQILSDLTGEPVRSLSFHRPLPELLKGERTIAGRTNAYAAELTRAYLSDSRGAWRVRDPLHYLHATAAPIVQLLIHPIWWGQRHQSAAERLEEFYLEATADLAPDARARFDADLAWTLPGVRRLNYKEPAWDS